MRLRTRLAAPAALVAALSFCSFLGGTTSAEGWTLDQRQAPDFTLAAGMNGVSAGTTLSSLRGKVVLIKFWLRDCPICRRTLPALQELQARWGGSGLVVLSVLHQWGPNDPVLRQFMQQNGYTFPVGTDADGSIAALYGVNTRPVDYLVGVDGRVQASNGAPPEVLSRALGHYRLRRASVPESMKSLRDAVWQYRMGPALLEATRAAAAADASAEAKAVATRVTALAEEDLASRGQWAAWLRAQGQARAGELRQAVDDAVREYTGGPLQAKADALKRQYAP